MVTVIKKQNLMDISHLSIITENLIVSKIERSGRNVKQK
jgi:hypothetical protein